VPLTAAWTQLRPHEQQRLLWRCPARFVGVAAGRGSGKTELLKRRLVRYLAVRKPWADPRYFYGAPTRDQAKRVAWAHLKALTPPEWLADEPSEGDLKIRTVFGSELQVLGLDKPQRIEGVQWDGCGLDESCDLKPGTFERNVLPALVHRNGWCWRIGVPKRQGVGARDFRRFCEEPPPGAASFTWPSSTVLTPEQLRFAQENSDAKDYAEQFDARWANAGGAIFHAYDPERSVRPCSYDPERVVLVGSDFNVDPMAWVLCHLSADGARLEVFDELWLRDTNTAAALDALWGRYAGHRGGWEFYGDASSRARKTSADSSDYAIIMGDERFKRAGRTVHYSTSNPSLKNRFAATNVMLKNAAGECRLHLDPRCKRLKQDLEARYYAPGTCEPADSGDTGHITDALGYVVWARFPLLIPLDEDVGEVTIRG